MCGTRALLEYLNLHPNIVAETREMNFFSNNQKLARGIAWYKASMPLSYSDQVSKQPLLYNVAGVIGQVIELESTIVLIPQYASPS